MPSRWFAPSSGGPEEQELTERLVGPDKDDLFEGERGLAGESSTEGQDRPGRLRCATVPARTRTTLTSRCYVRAG